MALPLKEALAFSSPRKLRTMPAGEGVAASEPTEAEEAYSVEVAAEAYSEEGAAEEASWAEEASASQLRDAAAGAVDPSAVVAGDAPRGAAAAWPRQ